MEINKRDGRTVNFNKNKITEAIMRAANEVGESNPNLAANLADKVTEELVNIVGSHSVEQIQDVVEKVLIEEGHVKIAKAYILYRNKRTEIRELDTKLMNTLDKITNLDAEDSDIKRENANVNGDTSMGVMLKYGSESAKEYNLRKLISPDIAQAHIDGDMHMHDLDFYTLTETCCQIDLEKLFKNGFNTGHGHLREPNSINSYSSLAAIAIQANQNDQHKQTYI